MSEIVEMGDDESERLDASSEKEDVGIRKGKGELLLPMGFKLVIATSEAQVDEWIVKLVYMWIQCFPGELLMNMGLSWPHHHPRHLKRRTKQLFCKSDAT